METMPRPELQKLQLARLKQTVERSYANVPFYKKLLDDAGCNPQDLKTLSDLEKFPFTKKSDLRDNYPFGLFAVPMQEVARLHASSGTKGKPTVVGYTKNDLDVWAEVCARSLAAASAHPGDIVHNAYGYGLFTGGLGVHYGAETLGCTVVPVSGGNTQRQIMLLQDFGARILCCTPSYALNIAYTIDELKINRSDLKLKIGIFGAEPWTEEMRTQLQERLQIKALDIYGLSEIMGPGVSMECEVGCNGLHIWEDHFLPEIVDSETGARLPYGQEGELVFTSLTKEAMPLLRYRTGDISKLNTELCKCGRTMVRMTRVRARLDDMLIIRGINLYPSEVEKVLLNMPGLAPHYQLIVDRDKALDRLAIHVEVSETQVAQWGNFEEATTEHSALIAKVQGQLKDMLGLTADICLKKPNSILRSEGKVVRVIDNRNQSADPTCSDGDKRNQPADPTRSDNKK
jgi:phenylacetate-CoA ligase